jgi:hypothetical protein
MFLGKLFFSWPNFNSCFVYTNSPLPPNTVENFTMYYLHMRYATNRKVAGSRPDEANEFLSIYLILPVALGPGVYSASNRNEYQKHKNNVSGE